MLIKVLLVGVAGALGTLARLGLSILVQRWCGVSFPWGPFTVNLIGCLFFGIVWGAAGGKAGIPEEVRLVILVGFMGGFTTFSTFAFESAEMLMDSRWAWVSGNVVGQNIFGIAFIFAGAWIGRLFS